MKAIMRWLLGVVFAVGLTASMLGQRQDSRTSTARAAANQVIVAQPKMTISTASPGSSWVLGLSVPPEIAVSEYDVEVGFQDPESGNWKYPGLLAAGFRGPNQAAMTIARESLVRLSNSATLWRVRARHAVPPGPWSDWMVFDIALKANSGQIKGVAQAATGGIARLTNARGEFEQMSVGIAAQLESLRDLAVILGKEGSEESAIAWASRLQTLAAKMKQIQDDMKQLQDYLDQLKDAAIRDSGKSAETKKR